MVRYANIIKLSPSSPSHLISEPFPPGNNYYPCNMLEVHTLDIISWYNFPSSVDVYATSFLFLK